MTVAGEGKDKTSPSLSSTSSKLLRPEMPLRRHGRRNRLASAIVSNHLDGGNLSSVARSEFKQREIL